MTIAELKELRAKKLGDAAALANKPAATKEEMDQARALFAEANDLKGQLELREQIDSANAEVRANPGRRSTPTNGESVTADIPEKDLQKYSIVRAISRIVDQRGLDGIEKAVNEEIATKMGKRANGFYMPWSLPMEKRSDFDISTGAGLQDKVTAHAQFIDLLRNKMVLSTLGVTVLNDLVGQFDVPKMTGGATAQWVSPGSAPTASSQTVQQVQLREKQISAFTNISRNLLKQTSATVENMVRNDLARAIGLGVEEVGIQGGSTNEPSGILTLTSQEVPVTSTFGWDDVIALETAVASANADVSSMGYLTNATLRGTMKSTPKVTAQAIYLWGDNNQVNGYPALVTNAVPTVSAGDPLIFGAWSEMLIGFWGGADILVDPYSLGTSGGVRVIVHQSADVQFRHDESFAFCYA